MSNAAAATLVQRSRQVASEAMRGGTYTSDLYWSALTLYQTANGKYYLFLHGGAGVSGGFDRWIDSRDEAAAWIAAHAADAVTGWGYTREQAETILDGGDPGRGLRRDDDQD
jgi:hypothetical protein